MRCGMTARYYAVTMATCPRYLLPVRCRAWRLHHGQGPRHGIRETASGQIHENDAAGYGAEVHALVGQRRYPSSTSGSSTSLSGAGSS